MSCHPEPCPVALPAKVDSPVEAGEVADEVRQKGGAPAEGVSKNMSDKKGERPRRGDFKAYFLQT